MADRKYVAIFVAGPVVRCYTPPSLRDQVAGGLRTAAEAAGKAVGNSLKWAGNLALCSCYQLNDMSIAPVEGGNNGRCQRNHH